MTLAEKFERLKKILRDMESVAVAFSGGVDSTFLLKVAHDTLGEKSIALTADSVFIPRSEIDYAKNFCAAEKIRHLIIKTDVLANEAIAANPPERCYICKLALFKNFLAVAKQNGCKFVAEGSNVDDTNDFRPGRKALAELDVKSPLLSAELSKIEIRELSRNFFLPTADKPSMACLATRFIFGDKLSSKRLAMVESAENFLRDIGIGQLRVRVHGNLARIEVEPKNFQTLLAVREDITEKFRALGFEFVAMDLQGYRVGSMNVGGQRR